MKAAIFEKPGLENLKIMQDIEEPKITDHDVLIKVNLSGVNPIDHFTVSGVRASWQRTFNQELPYEPLFQIY